LFPYYYRWGFGYVLLFRNRNRFGIGNRMKTKPSISCVTKGIRFLGSDDPKDIFTVLSKHESTPNVWNCKHIQLEGEWGFEEEFIQSNLIQEKQKAA